MKYLIFLAFSPIVLFAQTPEPQKLTWTPVSYEKIILPTHNPEAVVFTKNESEGKFAYTISYQVGSRTVSTRVLPMEIYMPLRNKLNHEVLSLTKIDVQGTCIRYFDIEVGKTNPEKTIRHCLSATKQRRAAEDAFSRWYRDARELLGL